MGTSDQQLSLAQLPLILLLDNPEEEIGIVEKGNCSVANSFDISLMGRVLEKQKAFLSPVTLLWKVQIAETMHN